MTKRNYQLIEEGREYLRTIDERAGKELFEEGVLRGKANPYLNINDPFLLRARVLTALKEFMKFDPHKAPPPVDPLFRFEQFLICIKHFIDETDRVKYMSIDTLCGLMICRLRLASLIKQIGERDFFNLDAIRNDAKAAFDWINAIFYDICDAPRQDTVRPPSLKEFLTKKYQSAESNKASVKLIFDIPSTGVYYGSRGSALRETIAEIELEPIDKILINQVSGRVYSRVDEIVRVTHDPRSSTLNEHSIDGILLDYFRSLEGFVVRMNPYDGLTFFGPNHSVATNGSQFLQAVVRKEENVSDMWQITICILDSEQGGKLFNANLFDF